MSTDKVSQIVFEAVQALQQTQAQPVPPTLPLEPERRALFATALATAQILGQDPRRPLGAAGTAVFDLWKKVVAAMPKRYTIQRGDAQVTAVGTITPLEPAIRVTDGAGQPPVPGIDITFVVTAGGGEVARPEAVTDQNGFASPGAWTLGPAAGANTLEASVDGVEVATFTALGFGAHYELHRGDQQTAPTGTALPLDPEIRVTDHLGQPVPDLNVAFVVTRGGGGVTNRAAVTDQNGVASAGNWTLGARRGVNTLEARVGGSAVATFTAFGQQYEVYQGDHQSGTPGTALPDEPEIRVSNAFDEPVQNHRITFAVTVGGGKVTKKGSVTDENGVASAGTWTLGPDPGVNALEARVGRIAVATFHARAEDRPGAGPPNPG